MAGSFARADSSRPGSVSCPGNTLVAASTDWGRISKRGDGYIRRLLVHGTRTELRWRRAKPGTEPGWTDRLLARRPTNVVLVAMANKTARVAWALLRYERSHQLTPA